MYFKLRYVIFVVQWIKDGFKETVGNTPLIKLNKLSHETGMIIVCTYVHIHTYVSMFYIQTNLRMLQHYVECNIQMFILCIRMMYFGDLVVLVPYISNEFMIYLI